MAKLVIKHNDQIIETLDLKPGDITIGRLPVNTFSIESNKISSRHVRFVTAGKTTYAQDLNSEFGTLINDQPIDRQKLRSNDVIQIGEYLISYETEDIPAATESPGVELTESSDDYKIDTQNLTPQGSDPTTDEITLDREQFIQQLRESEEQLFGNNESDSDRKNPPEFNVDLDATTKLDSTLGHLRDVIDSLKDPQSSDGNASPGEIDRDPARQNENYLKWTRRIAELPDIDIDLSELEIPYFASTADFDSPVTESREELLSAQLAPETENASSVSNDQILDAPNKENDKSLETGSSDLPDSGEVSPQPAFQYPRLRLLAGANYGAHIKLCRDIMTIGFEGDRQLDINRKDNNFYINAGSDAQEIQLNGVLLSQEGRMLEEADIIEFAGMRLRFSKQ